MDTLDGENMKTLDVFVKEIHKNLNGVKTDTVSGKKAVTKKRQSLLRKKSSDQ